MNGMNGANERADASDRGPTPGQFEWKREWVLPPGSTQESPQGLVSIGQRLDIDKVRQIGNRR